MIYKYSQEYINDDSDIVLKLYWNVTGFNVLNGTMLIDWKLTGVNNITNVTAVANFRSLSSSDPLKIPKIDLAIDNSGEEITLFTGSFEFSTSGKSGSNDYYLYSTLGGNHIIGNTISPKGQAWDLKAKFTVDNVPAPTVVCTSATEFTDEENPSISYKVGKHLDASYITKVEAAISFTGGADDVPYREVTKPRNTHTVYSYTFELTEEERKTLCARATKQVTPVRFYIKTTHRSGSVTWNYTENNFTVINGEPVLNPTVKDVHARANYLTGSQDKFIRYCSIAEFDTGAQGTKEATIVSQYVLNGTQTVKDTNTGTIHGIDSNTFYFGATDSRGYSIKDFKVVDLVPYIKLTAYIEEAKMNTDGNLTFTVKGNYFNGSFGAHNNSLEVEYLLEAENADAEWVIIQPTIDTDENTYSATHTITGLNYRDRYKLTVNVIDEITSIQTETKTITALPVYDWSDSDFRHNTDVYLNTDTKLCGYDEEANGIEIASIDGGKVKIGDISKDTEIHGDTINLVADSIKLNGEILGGTSKVLWSGASHMNANQSAPLNDLISKQANGIVLVFSLYRNGAAEDVSINSFYVSKKEVELLEGAPHSFFMLINSGFSTIGAKYLNIYDNVILGNATNTTSGANNGISFNNSSFVLRYVIGV